MSKIRELSPPEVERLLQIAEDMLEYTECAYTHNRVGEQFCGKCTWCELHDFLATVKGDRNHE